jgi:hypothetical protein
VVGASGSSRLKANDDSPSSKNKYFYTLAAGAKTSVIFHLHFATDLGEKEINLFQNKPKITRQGQTREEKGKGDECASQLPANQWR